MTHVQYYGFSTIPFLKNSLRELKCFIFYLIIIIIIIIIIKCFYYVSHDNSSISITLSRWPYLAITNVTAPLHILILYLSAPWWGLHTDDAYSSVGGCRSALYVCSLVVHDAPLIFLFTNPRARFPFESTFADCLPHDRSLVTITPSYTASSTAFKGTPFRE